MKRQISKPAAFSRFADASAPAAAPRRPIEKIVHGRALVDDWAWLRAAQWQEVLKDPAVLPTDIRAVLEGENAYVDRLMAPTATFQKKLVAEMRARIKEDDVDVPSRDGDYEYYERYREGGEHELICRRRLDGAEEILLDGDALAHGKSFFELGDAQVSPDHRLLAWTVDDKGSEYYTLRVRDIAAERNLPDVIEDSDGGAVWTADGRAFLYVKMDENHRPTRVFKHLLGTDPAQDRLVYHEPDPAWFVNVRRSRSRRFAVIDISDHDSSEAHLVDLDDPDAPARCVEPRARGLRYHVEPHGERLFIRTNADDAEDFKIVEAPLAAPGRMNWRDVVAHRRGRMIVRIDVFADYLVRLEREDGLPRIVVRAIATGDEHAVTFDEEAFSLSLVPVREFATSTMRFAYSSMTTPEETFDYDMRARERHLRKRQEVPSGHDPANYVTRRLFATAPDGEQVPISLLYRRGTPLDGSAPLFLNGYGAYGYAASASFGTGRLSLVDRGFIYAIAHIRGGTDKGWHWYTDGKLAKKPNTFTDFIAIARHLAAEKFTSQGLIVASGGSAGGMLMGAVANMAPNLFAGIVADVPFVDVVNTMMDTTLPLTPPEWLEWGNPIEDADAFARMLSYSPYDNVSAQNYPAILALGGLTDPRVTYWEPAKWVARLRATMTGGGPVALKTNMDAGHGGASGRFDSLKEAALKFAFAVACIEQAREKLS